MLIQASRRVATLLVSILFVLAGTPEASGMCVCADLGVEEQIRDADVIFEGTVIGVHGYTLSAGEFARLSDSLSYQPRSVVKSDRYALFLVTESWKGARTRDLVVSTNWLFTACGYNFEEGKRYVVYAYRGKNGLHTDRCTRTQLVENADADTRKLREWSAKFEEKVDIPAGKVWETSTEILESRGYFWGPYNSRYPYERRFFIEGTKFAYYLHPIEEATVMHLENLELPVPDQIEKEARNFFREVIESLESEPK